MSVAEIDQELANINNGEVRSLSVDEQIIEDELTYLECLILNRKDLKNELDSAKDDKLVSKLIRKSSKREVKFLARESQKLAAKLLDKGVNKSVIAKAINHAGRNGRLTDYSLEEFEETS